MKTPRNPLAKEMATNPGAYRVRVVKARKGKGAYRRDRRVVED
jgi:stalled ribosome alternative rescue factor ArfA